MPEISNTTDALDRLDDDEKAKLNLGLSGGPTNCVNEPGLYSLVLSSKLPSAKKFRRWVTAEVLPSIRKTGSYTFDGTSKELQAILLLPLCALRGRGGVSTLLPRWRWLGRRCVFIASSFWKLSNKFINFKF